MTGVILTGGQSRRLGRNKALQPWEGRPLIQHVVERLRPAVDDVLVVGGEDIAPYLPLGQEGVRVVADIYPGAGSLGGIYTGLYHSQHDLAAAVACDMPFLSAKLLSAMRAMAEGFDIVVPRVAGQVETLHAVYRRSCLPFIDDALRQGPARIVSFFERVRVRYLDDEEIAALDADPHIFFNINTEDDLARAQAIAASRGAE